MTDDERFVERVQEGARLESPAEAEDAIRAVTGAMADHFPPAAWELIGGLLPGRLHGESARGDRGSASADALFADVGERRQLATATAARYARVVAEALRGMLDREQVERLEKTLPDEFLALFESHHRGELTEEDGATPGARIVGSTGGDERGSGRD